MTRKRFILHMGLPKCASTSLQDTLVHARHIGYLGKTTGGAFADPLIAEFTRVIAVFGDVRLRNCAPHRAALQEAFEECPHDTVWLSDEVLSSAGFVAFGQSNSLPQILENFKRIAPAEVEPVIVVRNQHSLLRSYFRQWVQWGSAETFEDFIRLIFLRRDRFLFPILNYVNLVRALQGIVPAVHVLCFEAPTKDSDYRGERLAALSVGDIADLLGQTHSRPAMDDAEIARRLRGRHPVHFASQWDWLAQSQYPDIYAYRPVTTPFGRSVMQALTAMEQRMQAPGAIEKRRAGIDENNLHALPEPLQRMLDAHVSRINEEIATLDPQVDWRAHGY
ncbi:hypothetical protein ACLB6G_08080 [Zhengella sp. ZM62]|uniref:hypothetical protein n=1 Tax=Zhengella sedimenti TaxID=3390035 RepID=UPI0039755D84